MQSNDPTFTATLLGHRLQYQGRKFGFEVARWQLPNGAQGEWEIILHPGGALAVPVTAEGKLVLVRQYRLAIGQKVLEFPAGTVEPTETPQMTIAREIEEETGYTAGRWQSLGQFPLAPGYSDEWIYAFLAQDLTKLAQPPAQDEDEDIEVVLLSPQEFGAAVREGQVIDAKTVTSFFLAQPFLS